MSPRYVPGFLIENWHESPILLAPQALLAELQAQQADAAMLDNGPETDYKQTFRPTIFGTSSPRVAALACPGLRRQPRGS